MALAKLPSVSVEGVEATPVGVEVDVAQGLPGFVVVGLADKAVEESRERVRSALRYSGFSFPISRITIHLAPSEQKKRGAHFDLAIALGVLLADGQLKHNQCFNDTIFLGGLSLDGQLQPIPGVLVMVEWAKRGGYKNVLIPIGNYAEARLISGVNLIPLATFSDAIDWVMENKDIALPTKFIKNKKQNFDEDWLQIQGQERAKRAVVISAAGGHNILLEGPPGAGKTLLAKGLRAILPDLDESELIEVVKIHSVAGEIKPNQSLSGLGRPFRSPHHSASNVALVGGGSHPRPGEISLAHRGVLFLDELPEFPRSVTEALRQPLESGEVHVSRAERALTFPANFMLVATMNPCPCGWLGSDQRRCSCSPGDIARYRKKISGPILDRIDLYLNVPALPLSTFRQHQEQSDELKEVKKLVAQTRLIESKRGAGVLNANLNANQIKDFCPIDQAAHDLLEKAAEKFVITGRGYHKLIKVARTIADLDQRERIEPQDVAESIQYRFPVTALS